MSSEVAETVLCSRLTGPAADWFRAALLSIRTRPQRGDGFLRIWSETGRRLGQSKVTLAASEQTPGAFSPDGWGADEFGRALLLLAVLQAEAPRARAVLVEELWRTGEIRERQALLRVLPYLPSPELFVAVGVEAMCNNATSVIEAIACENPYPARFFSAAAFNQLVLKCLFCGVSLRRVVGLAGRLSPELQRMVSAYASERAAAGRLVSEDADLVLAEGAHASV